MLTRLFVVRIAIDIEPPLLYGSGPFCPVNTSVPFPEFAMSVTDLASRSTDAQLTPLKGHIGWRSLRIESSLFYIMSVSQ